VVPSSIFITARFRTGSTMLWNVFRQIPEVTAYYEPLHEKLPHWMASKTSPQLSHYHVDTYFREYPSVKELSSHHLAEFGVCRLYLEATDQYPQLKQYIQYLLTLAKAGKVSVLQFNRIDFRLPWVKANFPGIPIIHLYRSSREQWLSSIAQYPHPVESNQDANPYAITSWARDLCQHFPFLAGPFIQHAYQRHYYLWKLSYLAGSQLADVSLSYEEILASPKQTLSTLLQVAGLNTQTNLERCLGVIVPKPLQTWNRYQCDEWFTPLEQECETTLTNLGLNQNFGKKPLSEIIAENNDYQKLIADRRAYTWAIHNGQLSIVNLEIAEEGRMAMEEAIRSPILSLCFSLLYWDLHHLRPFLKRLLPEHIKNRILRIRGMFHSRVGELSQYSPIPLKIPKHYSESAISSPHVLPVVSIVTPSRNQAQFVERTIKSVLDQNYPNLEYIFQDGASADGTNLIVEKYRLQLKQIESCQDTGQANAINRGFRHATGDILAWLNSDDILLPGTIAYVVNFFLKHPEVDVVYGHRIIIDEHDQEIGRWILPPHDQNILIWIDYIPQETLFWRRQIWEKAGGHIDESYHFALDWELLLRFRDVGAKFIRLPRFLAAFRAHSYQKSFRNLTEPRLCEIQRLMKYCHGREVSEFEILKNIRYYKFKQVVYEYLYRLRLFQF
jgi:glycosyltransferase involved in cell wall biosynthesis